MASNQGNNNIVSGTRSTRLNSFDRVPIVKSPSRLGNGFAANSRAWDSNANIWANENNLNPFAEGAVDPELHNGTALDSNGDVRYPRGKSGSGSLLSSSESVSWEHRSNLPWNTGANHSSPVSPRQQGPAHSSSQLRNAELTTNTAGLQSDYRDMSPFLPIGQHSRFDTADNGLQEPPRRSNNTSEQRKSNSYTYGNLYNLSHEDDGQGGINGSNFRASDSSGPIQSGLRFLNTAHEVRPLPSGRFQRTSLAAHLRNNFDLPEAQPRLPQASNPPNLRYNSTAHSSSRRPGAHNSAPSGRQDSALQFDGQDDQLLLKFHGMNLQTEVMPQDFTPGFQTQVSSQRTASKLGRSLQAGISRPKNHISSEYFSLADPQPALSDGTADTSYQILADYRQSLSFGEPESSSPALSDRRRGLGSPLYSTNTGTPPSGPGSVRSASDTGLSNPPSNGQMVTLDCEPRGSRPFHLEEHYMLSNTSHARLQYSQPFEIDGYPGSLRLNPLAVPYPIPTYGGLINSYQPRYPSREHDSSQIVRSALLEEFRANHKTSKRYELKDIYNHVVEFSGDQHGSRFIQQKLETANSDEKDQIFAEIQPNSLQLMTDVFGNYVIQKLFEHGNQTQKKILANQMKSRVMDLSTQMYGCRVVQKALEHILTDQQASMVKELEAHVLKCVKDQNGNHVIQKAIERVPAEHVQFIVNAFTGQVSRLAAHPYGCRVIQRMLEHCEEPARQSILRELHTGVYPLITDQYGNYVIQHVIEKGHEYDRTKVVATVISQLLSFSKHKFASNVVEKSIQCAEAGQRAEILRILTTPNDKGESPLLGLMRDQYGNYVIQKSLGDFGFKDEEREHLVEHCKPEFSKLKRFSSGKQVMALEKLIFEGDSEPNLSSSQSSTIPSTNTSTVEGPTTLTLPPVHILKSSFIPEPATSVASTP